MECKEGIKIAGVSPEIVLAIFCADSIWTRFNQDLVVTEVTGGKHGVGSLHYVGHAVDLRTRYFSNTEKQLVFEALKKALGENYDVILHSTHIHVEFQPK
jgi:hypothetical protein